ncbi:DUF4397 domain-containing protein [Pedobacter nutrimenti]|nr:DUF4397 domain-containing protein [Pedobacter nutrimenti]
MMMTLFAKSISRSLHPVLTGLALALGSLLFQSCSKDQAPDVKGSSLTVVNASPTMATYNFYLNDQKANGAAALPFAGAVSPKVWQSGAYKAKFTIASNTESVITKDISLAPDKAYSLFLIDKADKLDYLLINDDLSKTGEKAFVRFINLSPDAASLDLAVKGGAVLIGDKVYKASSAFTEVDPKDYVFEIRDKATGTVKGAALASITLAKGKYYTVTALGLLQPTGTDQAFTGKVFPY